MNIKSEYSRNKIRRFKEFITNNLPLLILISVFTLIFILLEIKYPYFFCDDDNRDFYLPKFVHNYNSIINGEIPFYNFHQFLGINSFANGQSTVFYPLTYLAVFISKFFFGHYYAAVDIVTYMHLLIGGVGFYLFICSLGVNKKGALFGAIAWQLNCFAIYGGNSWYINSTVIAYLPWIMLFNIKLIKSPSIKNICGILVFKLFLFYSGHIQNFIYTLIFEFLAFILFTLIYKDKKLFLKRITSHILANASTLFLILPLLLPGWIQTDISAARSEALSWEDFLLGKLDFPYFINEIIHPTATVGYYTIINMGFLTLVFFIVSLIFMFIRNKSNLNSKKFTVTFLLLFFLAAAWLCSSNFNGIIYHIPLLNRFRFIFKLLSFSNFFFISISSIGIAQFLDWIKIRNNLKLALYGLIFVAHILNFSVLYLNTTKKGFYYHKDKLPINEPFKSQFGDDRIVSIGFSEMGGAAGYSAPSLSFNYATLLGLNHFSGYEPLLSKVNYLNTLKLNYWSGTAVLKGPLPLDYFRKWGVKWYVASKDYDFAKTDNLVPKFTDKYRTIYYDSKALPLFYFDKDKSYSGIEYKIKTNSIILKVNSSIEDKLGINYLYNPDFNATIDGRPVDIQSGDHYQIMLPISKGEHIIEIKYSDPSFILGCVVSLVYMAAMLILIVSFKFYRKTKTKRLLSSI